MNKNKDRFLGTILSYANILVGLGITLFMVPGLLQSCGDSEYSVYRIMSSYVSQISFMNLGVSAYVSRGIALCNQQNKKNDDFDRRRIMGMSLVISGLLMLSVVLISVLFYMRIDELYGKTFTSFELELAKKLFVILSLNLSIQILGNGFQGCIGGNEHFVASKTLLVGKNILRAVFIVLIIQTGSGTLAIAGGDLFLTILLFIAEFLYVRLKLKEHFCFKGFKRSEFNIFLTFAVAMLLQTIINNINNSIDLVLLGIYEPNKTVISMYSSALTIYTTFISVSYTISGVFRPSIIRAVAAEESAESLTEKAEIPAKYQAIVSIAICFGFILFGDNFIKVWIGQEYINAYYVCMILMIPATLTSISGIYEAFLDAKLKRLTRSFILSGMAGYNFVVSVFLLQRIGFWGAAIGTATSLVFGNLILMNWYSGKVSGVSAVKLYQKALGPLVKPILFTVVVMLPFKILINDTLMGLFFKLIVYVIVYGFLVTCIGLKWNYKKKFHELFDRRR